MSMSYDIAENPIAEESDYRMEVLMACRRLIRLDKDTYNDEEREEAVQMSDQRAQEEASQQVCFILTEYEYCTHLSWATDSSLARTHSRRCSPLAAMHMRLGGLRRTEWGEWTWRLNQNRKTTMTLRQSINWSRSFIVCHVHVQYSRIDRFPVASSSLSLTPYSLCALFSIEFLVCAETILFFHSYPYMYE